MNYVRPTPDSLFGDVPDRASRKAAEMAQDRENWKSRRLQSVTNLFMWKCSKTYMRQKAVRHKTFQQRAGIVA